MHAHTRLLLLVAAVVALGVGIGRVWFGRVSGGEAYRAGLAALDEGDWPGARRWADLLSQREGFRPHSRLLSSAVTLRSGDPELALRQAADVPAERELRVPTLLLRGECLYRLGRLSEAEPMFRQLSVEWPDHPAPHRWLGAIYYDIGANDAAIAELKRLAELERDDYSPHRLLGLMYFDFELNSLAIEQYEQALALSPPPSVRAEMVHELARALVAERDYQKALDHLAGETPDAAVLALRAECLWSLGRQDEARDCLQAARTEGQSGRLLDLLAARIHLSDGSIDEAIAILEDALQRDPHDAECRYQLALCFRQLGQDERSAQELARWRESTDLLNRLTELNIDAVERPGDAAVRDELALLCDRLGKTELAEMWRRAAETCRSARAAQTAAPSNVALPHTHSKAP